MIIDIEKKLNGTIPVTREELFKLVNSWGRKDSFSTNDNINIKKSKQLECYPLENLDVSQIENLSYIFRDSLYNGDLSKWDVSNCKTMDRMFSYSEFNNDSICNWNISNLIRTDYMFANSIFNQDLSKWNVSKLNFLEGMFAFSNFNNNSLNNWNTINFFNLSYMFYFSEFKGDISSWNTRGVNFIDHMFEKSSFDGDISKWDFYSVMDVNRFVYNNINFKNKYNNGEELPCNMNRFLEWFEDNRENIKNKNISKEQILDFFDFNKEKEINI